MPFLDQIVHGEAEMAELRRHGNYQPHMGGGDLVKGFLIVMLLPTHSQLVLFLPGQIGGGHGGLDEVATRGLGLHDGTFRKRR